MRFSRRSQPPSSDARRRPLEKIALPHRRGFLSHIAAVDLDIAVIGQLSAAQLPLGDVLEPRSVQVITLNAPLEYWGQDMAIHLPRATSVPPRTLPLEVL